MRLIVGLSVAALLAGSACATKEIAESESVATLAEATKENSNLVRSSDAVDAELALLASQERVRPANFYRLETSAEPEVCDAALAALNQRYAVPEDLLTVQDLVTGVPRGNRDYSAHQAAYYLGTNDNVRWSARRFNWPGAATAPRPTESAFIDFYGDGRERLVIRKFDSTRGGERRQVSVLEFIDGHLIGNDVNSAAFGGTVPQDNAIGSLMDFSVADVIKLRERYYTLIMPLLDVDKSGRVYIAKMYERGPPPGNQTGYRLSEWFPRLICTIVPR